MSDRNILIEALSVARGYIVSSELSWRSQLAEAVAEGVLSRDLAVLLTSGARDDTKALMLGKAIGPKQTRIDDPIWKQMAENISNDLLEIADEMEQENA